MFQTIALATDGSDSAERAISLALDFAETFDATLYACYVVSGDADTEIDRERGRDALDDIEARDGSVTTTIREGQPAAEICSYATEIDADLVVMGTRGRDGEHRNLIGSVAEAVVGDSPAPVLTARQLAEESPTDVPVSGVEE